MTKPQPSKPQPPPFDIQDQLARERNHLAADRTLLSFLRSSLTLISLGVGVDQVVRALSPRSRYSDEWGYSLSLIFIGLGVFNLLLATLDYQNEIKRLQAPEYVFTPRWSLGGAVGLIVLVIGLGTLCWLSLKLLR